MYAHCLWKTTSGSHPVTHGVMGRAIARDPQRQRVETGI